MEMCERFVEAADTAGIGDLTGRSGHGLIVGDGFVNAFVGDLDAGVAGGEQTDKDGPADGGVGVGGIG